MFSMLLRAIHGRQSSAAEAHPHMDSFEPLYDHDAPAGPATRNAYTHLRHATADFTEADDDDDDDDDDDGDRRSSHVLPLFSASHLDSLPVYGIVHAIRIIVQARTETTLSWEQLRSPQVSQFLVKPMQQQIRAQHFSRATLYALMANCLQFSKESQFYPGNAGTSNTRAKVCELLAIKLLKEYTTRELIDALSYDFNPLQGLPGMPPHQASSPSMSRDGRHLGLPPAARISTLEVAIRASAKHFLAHPLVVQQLEAIWSGAISFYSSADSLHRSKTNVPPSSTASPAATTAPWNRSTGVFRTGRRQSSAVDLHTPLLGPGSRSQSPYTGQQTSHPQPPKEEQGRLPAQPNQNGQPLHRRSVTLYDPRNASLFKLSRLRVPRYRQLFSTCSLAVLIGLFLSVLIQRPSRITTLELVFWFWSAGFMLDELVGFNEQGFSLYIMSFWNIFDLGILLLLIFYYSLRICGVFLADAQRWNDSAYDILAANAILLLPRIFSVLDHYQYFSQLLIAFRLMAVDLAAVFILIVVSCSGFFVFFTLSRSENNASDVAFRIFQLLMGFTPAAWDMWPSYNFLGKSLLVLFLIICHFVVVTILITVLTNSFMAIASNANEEHQFLFAINTISMVKNDALFSYVAPTNIFAWMMTPLRYCMPLPHFVALNRLVIKATHFPILFGIFAYEKFFLAPFIYEPTDLVENTRGRRNRGISMADPANRSVLFSPSIRVREESVVGYQKDRALDEVFRRAPDLATLRTQRRNERRKTQTAIRNWMDQNDGLVGSQHNYSTLEGRLDHEWQRRMSVTRERNGSHRFRHMSDVRSAASDPADLVSISAAPVLLTRDRRPLDSADRLGLFEAAFKDHTDAEGDDELVTNDEDEENTTNTGGPGRTPQQLVPEQVGDGDVDGEEDGDYFATPTTSRFLNVAARSPQSPQSTVVDNRDGGEANSRGEGPVGHLNEMVAGASPPTQNTNRSALHSRALSSNTILYNPPETDSDDEALLPYRSPDASAAHQASTAVPTTAMPQPPPPPPPPPPRRTRPSVRRHNNTPSTSATPTSGQRSPRKAGTGGGAGVGGVAGAAQPRPILGPRELTTMLDTPERRAQRRVSSFDTETEAPSDLTSALTSAVGVGPLGDDGTFGGALPGSFTSQLVLATALNQARVGGENERDRDRMSRLVLARMKTLEESFTDVVRELRSLQQQQQQQHWEVGLASGHASGHVSAGSDSSRSGERGMKGGVRTPVVTAVLGTGTDRPGEPHAGGSGGGSGSRPLVSLAQQGRRSKGKGVERGPTVETDAKKELF